MSPAWSIATTNAKETALRGGCCRLSWRQLAQLILVARSRPMSEPTSSTPQSDLVPPTSRPADLRPLLRAIDNLRLGRALTTPPKIRAQAAANVRLLSQATRAVSGPLLVPEGFVDGIQAALCLTFRNHRPVYLMYVAAGSVKSPRQPNALKEVLWLVCSEADALWARSLSHDVTVVTLAETDPEAVEAAAHALLGTTRARFEKDLIRQLVAAGRVPLVVDGALAGRQPHDGLLGVVKTTATQYLPDERVIANLRHGWRSPIFEITEGAEGQPGRYSAYLRLFDASTHGWRFGLIRLEAFSAELIDPLAALAMDQKQNPAAGDPRFDRHLVGIRDVEDFLRARRPSIFE